MSLNERDYMREGHTHRPGPPPAPVPLLARIKFALWRLLHPSTPSRTPPLMSTKLPEPKENENDK